MLVLHLGMLAGFHGPICSRVAASKHSLVLLDQLVERDLYNEKSLKSSYLNCSIFLRNKNNETRRITPSLLV